MEFSLQYIEMSKGVKMSLQNLCAKRELFLTQYADMEESIQTLRELYKDNNEKLRDY